MHECRAATRGKGLPVQGGGARRERRRSRLRQHDADHHGTLLDRSGRVRHRDVPPARRSRAPSRPPPSARVLVVPFENARDEPRFHWLSEAAAVLLTDGLRAGGPGAIVRSQRVRAFEQLYLPVSGSLSRATIIKVGQLVGAADVVMGSYRVDGTTLSVTARSIRLDAGRLQPEVTERGELTELFGIFERLAGRLGRAAGRVAGPAAAHPPLDAFENYIKGLLAESPVSQASFLEAALRDAPTFDRARLALWEVRTEQADHAGGARHRARRARPTSPSSFHAQFFAGISLIELKRYDEALGVLQVVAGIAGRGTDRPRRRAQQPRRPGPSPRGDAADGFGGLLPDQGDRRRSRSRLHVQPRVRVRVGSQLSGRALLVARGPAPRSGRRRRALRAGRGA